MLATRRPSFFPLPSPIILLFNSVSQLWVINSWRQRATYRQMSVSEPRAGRLYFEGVNHCIDSPRSRNRCHCKFYSRSHLSASDILWGKGNCFERPFCWKLKSQPNNRTKGWAPQQSPAPAPAARRAATEALTPHAAADPRVHRGLNLPPRSLRHFWTAPKEDRRATAWRRIRFSQSVWSFSKSYICHPTLRWRHASGKKGRGHANTAAKEASRKGNYQTCPRFCSSVFPHWQGFAKLFCRAFTALVCHV